VPEDFPVVSSPANKGKSKNDVFKIKDEIFLRLYEANTLKSEPIGFVEIRMA
jgi:hypothetical protein